MEAETQTLIGLLMILSLGLIAPEISKRTVHLPFVTSIILIGAIFGPHGLNAIQSTEVIEFFGFLGFTFLMLMAGLETRIDSIKKEVRKISFLATCNAGVPFLTGMLIGRAFDYSWITSLLIGTIFVSSSVAIIIPFTSAKKVGKEMKEIMLPAFIIQDILSVILLTSILQAVSPITKFPLPLYFGILFLSIAALYFALPKITDFFLHKHILNKKAENEGKLRFVIVVLMAVLLFFSILGVHPILASFLVGMLIGGVAEDGIGEKIHTLGYGLFVPVFFFIVGMEMDLKIFAEFDVRNILILSIIAGLLLSKFFSGYIAARIVKLKQRNAAIFGVVSTTQLTTTLAAAYAASSIGLFDAPLITAVVTLSIVTNIVVPITLSFLIKEKGIALLPWRP